MAAGNQAELIQDIPALSEELRRELHSRLFMILVAIVAGMIVGFVGTPHVLGYFTRMVVQILPWTLYLVGVTREWFWVFCGIAFRTGIAIAMPIVLYQLARLLAPKLSLKEHCFLCTTLIAASMSFIGSVIIVVPRILAVYLPLSINLTSGYLYNSPKMELILGFCSDLALWTGLAFELPVVMFLFATLNITPYRLLRRSRKYAAVGLMILAAVITPTPDALSMLIIWAPLYLLFEFGLVLARFARPRPAASTLALLAGAACIAFARRKGYREVAPA